MVDNPKPSSRTFCDANPAICQAVKTSLVNTANAAPYVAGAIVVGAVVFAIVTSPVTVTAVGCIAAAALIGSIYSSTD